MCVYVGVLLSGTLTLEQLSVVTSCDCRVAQTQRGHALECPLECSVAHLDQTRLNSLKKKEKTEKRKVLVGRNGTRRCSESVGLQPKPKPLLSPITGKGNSTTQ